jgi:hypothetical protein
MLKSLYSKGFWMEMKKFIGKRLYNVLIEVGNRLITGKFCGKWLYLSRKTLSINLNMATAGYSGTPLLKKLGIKPDMKVLLIDQPNDYFKLPGSDLRKQLCKKNEAPSLVHLFVGSVKEFEREMKRLKPIYKKSPVFIIWVSWYKKSSKIPTDITEHIIRNYALKNDLVDVKVCAVSELWSGLKLVVPLNKRK